MIGFGLTVGPLTCCQQWWRLTLDFEQVSLNVQRLTPSDLQHSCLRFLLTLMVMQSCQSSSSASRGTWIQQGELISSIVVVTQTSWFCGSATDPRTCHCVDCTRQSGYSLLCHWEGCNGALCYRCWWWICSGIWIEETASWGQLIMLHS